MAAHLLRNLVLLSVVLVLGVLVYLAPDPDPPAPALTSLNPEAITRITISRPERDLIELARRDKQWHLRQPLQTRAENFSVNRILAVAQAPSRSRYPLEANQRPRYGLDPPIVSLQLDDVTLHFGDRSPLDGSRYTEVGAMLHLIADPLRNIATEATELIDRNPYPDRARIKALMLPGLELRRHVTGGWTVTPEPDGSSADAAQILVDHWMHVRALEVKALQPGGERRGAVTLATPEHPLQLELRERAGDLYLLRADLGLEYRLGESATERLLRLP